MKSINTNVVKIKNLIGIIDSPTYEDLLFEIVSFLDNEKQYSGEFKVRDVYLKTKTRILVDLTEDIEELVKRGYVEKLNQNYKIIKHLWESQN